MKPKHIKKLLMSEIETVANASDKYCSNPGRDFSRKYQSRITVRQERQLGKISRRRWKARIRP